MEGMMKSRIVLSVLVIVTLLLALAPQAHPVSAAGVPRQYLILTKDTAKVNPSVLTAITKAGGTVTKVFDAIGVVAASSNNANFYSTLKKNTYIQNVSEDVEVNWLPTNEKVIMEDSQETVTADGLGALVEPRGELQWNMVQIHADQTAAAGDQGWGVVRARVAVLDAGIITTHPDIASNLNLALSTSFVPSEPDLNPPMGLFNHGTHVAGIIAAPINGYGVQGVAPKAEIVAVKVLSAAGSGEFEWLVEGIMYAAGPVVDADVINMSLGATFDRINAGGDGAGPLLSSLNRAINYATASGTLVVSSAGNDAVNLNSRIFTIPAQSGNGMAVSATGPIGWATSTFDGNFDRFASYSNYGQSVINVAAPGGDFAYPTDENCTVVTSAGTLVRPCWAFDMVFSPASYSLAGYSFSWAAGTSMAAPHVSGLAALLVGKYGHMSPNTLKAMIQNSADDIFKAGADPQSGKGRINAWKALNGK
jgi:lantibiotic leader peptide-processing serine protease